MASKHLTVHGTVQGVSYRAAARERARELGVAGWVRNADDGTVEMVVEGDDDAVAAMIGWAHEGPAYASVTGVDVADTASGGHTDFVQA